MLLNSQISIFYFLKLIKWDVIGIFSYALVVGALDNFAFFKDITFPLGLSALIGTLLSLLLAFRISQSYERWWEARTVWGAIVNDSRTLIRQLIEFVPNGEQKTYYLQSFAVRQSMWCYALTVMLRRADNPEHLEKYLADHELEAAHLPNLLLTRHAEALATITQQFDLNPNRQIQIDSTIQRLTDSMGRCERIKNTVFPRSYSVLIHFMIYVFMTILPFGLDDNHPIVEILISTMVPTLFIAIERTAILMQDPFENRPTDTPITTISASIERNLHEMSAMPAPKRQSAEMDYYVM